MKRESLHLFLIISCLYLHNGHGQSTKSSWSSVTDGTCKFTVNHGLDIRFEQNPLLFIDRLHTKDTSSCRKLCCDHNTCNAYVWDAESVTGSAPPCKLLKCSNEGLYTLVKSVARQYPNRTVPDQTVPFLSPF